MRTTSSEVFLEACAVVEAPWAWENADLPEPPNPKKCKVTRKWLKGLPQNNPKSSPKSNFLTRNVTQKCQKATFGVTLGRPQKSNFDPKRDSKVSKVTFGVTLRETPKVTFYSLSSDFDFLRGSGVLEGQHFLKP